MDRLLTDIDKLQIGDGLPAADSRQAVEALVRRGLRADWAHAGVYRAWREAVANDAAVAKLDAQVARWTTARTAEMLRAAAQLPGARPNVNVDVLAAVLTELFWKVAETPADQRDVVAAVVVDLIVHALLRDLPQ